MIVDFDPVALAIGPIAIRWYGLAYMVGFLGAWWWAKYLIRRFGMPDHRGITPEMIDDFMTYAILGVIIGGRMGEVIFYNLSYYSAHPMEVFYIWQGGMSFHGGVVGVLLASWLFSHGRHIALRDLGDLVCAGLPIGLMFGRIANFINGELWGRTSDVSWAMIFPRSGDMLTRHPSTLYEAALEGLVLFLLLTWWILARKGLHRAGMISGMFFAGYAVVRSIAELFREPDAHIGLLSFGSTWGQWLSLPMLLVGGWLMFTAQRQK